MVRADRVIPDVLAEVLRKAPLCDEKVEFAWRSAVGPLVQRVTKVRLDSTGVLHVVADTEHWAREVKRSSRVILARLAPLLGNQIVKRIKVS